MADELDTRFRALLAERYRPAITRPQADPLSELIGLLDSLFTTPPDSLPETGHRRERDQR